MNKQIAPGMTASKSLDSKNRTPQTIEQVTQWISTDTAILKQNHP